MKRPNPYTYSYPEIMKLIKAHLRRERMTYARLAKSMGVSESTLKKWFRAKDGSFNRINQVCESAGLSLHGLFLELQEQSLVTLRFGKEQQELFLSSKLAFEAYWLLVYERLSKEQAAERLGVSALKLMNVLYKLDKLALLHVLPGDRVKVPSMRPVQWDFSGVFMRSLRKKWMDQIIGDADTDGARHRVSLQFFQLTSQQADEFRAELERLQDKYARLTILTLSRAEKQRTQIRFLAAQGEGSFVRGH